MDILTTIINELMDSKISIESPLLKTKVLANKIKNADLLSWVNSELTGYSQNDLPDYRIFKAEIRGTIIKDGYKYTNYPILAIGVEGNLKKYLEEICFQGSIKSIESLIQQYQTNNDLGENLFPEAITLLQHHIMLSKFPKYQILDAHKICSSESPIQIIACVRSKLLEFIIKIDEDLGNNLDMNELKKHNESITKIMNKITIKNSGDKALINR
jgi:hypothetical protein